jgi:hypothetical protein
MRAGEWAPEGRKERGVLQRPCGLTNGKQGEVTT